MLILKGEIGKSRVVENIINNTNACCFIYDKDFVWSIPNSYRIDSNECSLVSFINELSFFIESDCKKDITYDYFIIYTNETEANLFDFIEWLKRNEKRFSSMCLLLTCR